MTSLAEPRYPIPYQKLAGERSDRLLIILAMLNAALAHTVYTSPTQTQKMNLAHIHLLPNLLWLSSCSANMTHQAGIMNNLPNREGVVIQCHRRKAGSIADFGKPTVVRRMNTNDTWGTRGLP